VTELRKMVTFNLADGRFALAVSVIQRIIRVVEITPLPAAPAGVLGIINLQGRIIPVFDIAARFGLPERTMQLSDQLIIAATARRTLALLVDSVDDVIEIPPEQIISAAQILPELPYVEGIVKTDAGLIFIHDIDAILSIGEEDVLGEAIEALEENG